MTASRSRSRRRTAWRGALAAALLSLGVVGAAHAADPEVPGEVLMQLRTTAALGPLLQKYQLTLASQFGARPIYRVKVAERADAHAQVEALSLEPDVLIVETNRVHRSPEARKNRAWAIGEPSAYTAQWAPQAIHLAQAHRRSVGGGIRVAVLDTGIDAAHPALAGRLLPGYDFVDGDLDPSEVGTANDLSFGHGTHVAGLVALVAPGAQIMPLRVLDANGDGNAWVLAEAMLHAADPDRNPATDDGAHVINMSLGSTSRTRVLDTIAKLAACTFEAAGDPALDVSDPGYDDDRTRCATSTRGAVVVAAAGNDGTDRVRQYPAAEGAYGLLAVGASNAAGRLASFSNYGSWVHLAAPGDGITSTIPGGAYATWSGTSMASPIVAGTAALVRAAAPQLAPRDVARRLERTATALCGTKLEQVDAALAVYNQRPPDSRCR